MDKIPVIDMKATGANIKRLREEKGISIYRLQMIMGLNGCSGIYQWQEGKRIPNIDNLLILSKLFGVHIDEILVTNTRVN